jgi:hypothetical protein
VQNIRAFISEHKTLAVNNKQGMILIKKANFLMAFIIMLDISPIHLNLFIFLGLNIEKQRIIPDAVPFILLKKINIQDF